MREGAPIPQTGIGQLISAVRREDWDFVDATIGADPNNPAYVGWASGGLSMPNPELRDLAATIIEKADTPTLFDHDTGRVAPDIVRGLHVAMVDQAGDRRFLPARFRAASALYKHDRPLPEAKAVIEDAARQTDDPELAEAAKARLGELEAA